MDEFEKLKAKFFTEMHVHYKNLINCLQQIPINDQFKTFSFQNLDQGIFWMQKGIELLKLSPKEKEEKEEKDLAPPNR